MTSKWIFKVGYVLAIGSAMLLSGCSEGPEDRIYQAFKCGKAATLLGREADAMLALQRVEADLEVIGGEVNPGAYMMEIGARFQEEVPLYRYSAGDQLQALEEIYSSQACQRLFEPQILNLSSAPLEVSAAPPNQQGSMPPSRTSPAAVLKIGQELVAEAQGAYTAQSVIDYCRSFEDVLTTPEDMHKCLRLVRVDATWRLNMPGVSDMTSAASTAASMSVLRRFAFCTSDQVVRHMQSFKDYDICMPQQVQASLQDALTEAMWKSRESAGVGPPAFPYANPFSHAATLTAEERVAYCAIPAIAEGFGPGDLEKCHKGIDELAQMSNLDSQNESGSVMEAHAALRSASKMRSQEDRSAFCNRSDILNVLSPEQVQECEVGLSPDNPGEHALTDDDPGYSDE